MGTRGLVALAAIVWLTLAGAGRAVADTPVAVSGTIANGTMSATLPTELFVGVVQLDSEGRQVANRLVAHTPGAEFRVEGFDLERGSRFAVATSYRGVTYRRVVEAAPGGGDLRADLMIYETTEDDSAITVASDVLTVTQKKADTLEVLQVLTVRNTSDRTVVGRAEGDSRAVLRLPLPAEALDVVPTSGITLGRVAGGGIVAADPLPPGERTISYIYELEVGGRGWPMQREVFYRTSHADILLGPGLRPSSRKLAFKEQVTIGDRTYLRYRSGRLAPGGVLEADIAPAAGRGGLWWGFGGAFLLVAAFGIGSVRRRRPGLRRPSDNARSDREALVERIAALDEAFDGGSVPESEYRSRRATMKAELQLLTPELRVAEEPPREQ